MRRKSDTCHEGYSPACTLLWPRFQQDTKGQVDNEEFDLFGHCIVHCSQLNFQACTLGIDIVIITIC